MSVHFPKDDWKPIEGDAFEYLKVPNIFAYPDAGVPGGYKYETDNETARNLGAPDPDPDPSKHDLPIGLTQHYGLVSRFLDEETHELLSNFGVAYSNSDHDRYGRLYTNMTGIIPGRVTPEVEEGVEWQRRLGSADRVPSFEDMNRDIEAATGWKIVPVLGLLSVDKFFLLLSRRKFPATVSIRTEAEFAYTSFPDGFHDKFGHVPMFLNPILAEFLEKFGELGTKFASEPEPLKSMLQAQLAKLYWYTIEFGLKGVPHHLAGRHPELFGNVKECRVYGAGILSSAAETPGSIELITAPDFDEKGNRSFGERVITRAPFDLERLFFTHYRFWETQEIYFVIDSWQQLLDLFGSAFDLEGKIRRHVAEFGSNEIPVGELLLDEPGLYRNGSPFVLVPHGGPVLDYAGELDPALRERARIKAARETGVAPDSSWAVIRTAQRRALHLERAAQIGVPADTSAIELLRRGEENFRQAELRRRNLPSDTTIETLFDTIRDEERAQFAETVGARPGADYDEIEEARQAKAVVEFCRAYNLPMMTYEQMSALKRGSFMEARLFVERHGPGKQLPPPAHFIRAIWQELQPRIIQSFVTGHDLPPAMKNMKWDEYYELRQAAEVAFKRDLARNRAGSAKKAEHKGRRSVRAGIIRHWRRMRFNQLAA